MSIASRAPQCAALFFLLFTLMLAGHAVAQSCPLSGGSTGSTINADGPGYETGSGPGWSEDGNSSASCGDWSSGNSGLTYGPALASVGLGSGGTGGQSLPVAGEWSGIVIQGSRQFNTKPSNTNVRYLQPVVGGVLTGQHELVGNLCLSCNGYRYGAERTSVNDTTGYHR